MPGIKFILPKHTASPSSFWDLASALDAPEVVSLSQTSVTSHKLFIVSRKPFLLSSSVWLPYILQKPNHSPWYPPPFLYLLPMHGLCVRILPTELCFQLCECLQLMSRDTSAWFYLPFQYRPANSESAICQDMTSKWIDSLRFKWSTVVLQGFHKLKISNIAKNLETEEMKCS